MLCDEHVSNQIIYTRLPTRFTTSEYAWLMHADDDCMCNMSFVISHTGTLY